MVGTSLRPKRGKRLGAFFLDALTIGCVSILVNLFSWNVSLALPSVKEATLSLAAAQKNVSDVIVSSHLNSFTEKGQFYAQNYLAEKYVVSLAKGSLLFHGVEEKDLSSFYADTPAINETNDRAYYYFVAFKTEHQNGYPSQDESGQNFYQELISKDLDGIFSQEGYPFLQEESAKILDEGLRNEDYKPGQNLKTKLVTRYLELLKKGAADLSTNYQPYLEAESAYLQKRNDFSRIQIAVAVLSSFVSGLILLFILPICNENRTIGQLVLKLDSENENGDPPSRGKSALQHAFFPLLLPMIAIFPVLFTPGFGADLLLCPLTGPLGLIFYASISLILLFIDYLFTFFGVKDTACERLAKTHLKMREGLHGTETR